MSECHYLSTPPALQRCVGENSTLYMFPPRPEAKSSEVATMKTLSLSVIGGKPWWFEACCINGRYNCNAFGLLQEHANRVGRPRLPSGNTHVIFM